jgi:hypothetical protein
MLAGSGPSSSKLVQREGGRSADQPMSVQDLNRSRKLAVVSFG